LLGYGSYATRGLLIRSIGQAEFSDCHCIMTREVEKVGPARQTHAGVDEQPDDRLVSPVLEALPFAGFDERLELVVGEHGDWLFDDLGWLHSLHRVGGDLALLPQPFEQLLQGGVSLSCRSRRTGGNDLGWGTAYVVHFDCSGVFR
jgi:hypothetical protein